ncbi:hypothetical protein N7492_007342 [Penicillium capsulatum]|uniref:Pathway-specific nitrogen regulator n=1 Tax=Penicillium capsulatum TaxID=69766 RepID=A0A9W9I4Z8_9EURO|nr:hypothetical protein N7492_007342 [Penicillium capsulatum]KAJ6117182.1 hypothetical protein N7512_006907 [Penicillium capsulatum]
MATVKDDEKSSYSNQILSPQPFTPPSKELFAALETSHMAPSETRSTIDDGQMSTHEDAYTSSGSSTRHSSSDIFGREIDADLDQLKSRASSRSSLSSIPASVMVHSLDQTKLNIHDKIAGYTIEDEEASFGGFHDPPRSIRTIRQREAAFRKPSSVRAMQMHTEDEADDDEFLTPPRRRAGMRSPGSSPLKRSPYYSPSASSNKPKVKKEYPLVLLHCTLLAPSLPVPGAALPQNQKIVEEVLPPQYWKRWRRLQDKAGSGVLRDRGVLISHPEDLYDMLEERLLESLELQRPRLEHGHFVGHEESGGAGSEGELSDQGESETDGEQGDECPDCGRRVMCHGNSNRKWEIRVYAANGLMRAGAWAAAWREMEKVDVEVGLWLPSDIRRALEKRLAEDSAKYTTGTAASDQAPELDTRPASPSRHTRGPSVADSVDSRPSDPVRVDPGSKPSERMNDAPKHQIALHTLCINYLRVLAGDRRNIALVLMSVLVVFLAIGSRQPILPAPAQAVLNSFPGAVQSPAISDMHVATPSVSAASSSMWGVEGVLTSTAPVDTSFTPINVSEAEDPEVENGVNETAPTATIEQQAPESSLVAESISTEDVEHVESALPEIERETASMESSQSSEQAHFTHSLVQSDLPYMGQTETSSAVADPEGTAQPEVEHVEDLDFVSTEATEEPFEADSLPEPETDEMPME